MDKRIKEAYIGKARHNLKNPINAILGYSEMLIEDCEDEGISSPISDLNKLYQAGQEILEIIEQNFDDVSTDINGVKTQADKDSSLSLRKYQFLLLGASNG